MASTIERAPLTPGRARSAARPGVWLTDALLLAMALIWGLNYTVVKFGVRTFAPLAFNGLRVALAAVALLVVAALTVRERWPSRADVLRLLGLGVLGNCVYQIFFIEGVARTRAGTAAIVLAASPAFIALVGRLRGSERIAPRGLVGIALSIAGVGLVMASGGSGGEDTLLGALLVLVGCLCWATFTVLLQPYTHRVNGVHLSALTMVGGAVPLFLVAVPSLVSTSWASVSPATWGAVAYSGIAALVVAYLFWYRGVRVLGPTRTAMYGNLQPVIALGFAWLALGEVPTIAQAAGIGAIMAGILMTRK
jgi:drug/metabolite transporter (DMT)-like permease